MDLELIQICSHPKLHRTHRTSLDGSKDDPNMITQDLYQDSRTSLDAYREVPPIAPTHPLGQEDHMCPQHVHGLVEGHGGRALCALPHDLTDRTRRARLRLSRAPGH